MTAFRLRWSNLDWVNTQDEGVTSTPTKYLATNPTEALLWEALAEGAREADRVSRFADVNEEKAREGVIADIDRLCGVNLLEEA